MVHHNSTPESIRRAPQLEPVLVHPTLGPNRAERRLTKVLVKESHRNEPARRLLSKKDKLAVSRRERKLRAAQQRGEVSNEQIIQDVLNTEVMKAVRNG